MTTYEKLKICLLFILVAGSLSFLYNYSNNGRFNTHNTLPIILDTQTGEVYILPKRERVDISQFN